MRDKDRSSRTGSPEKERTETCRWENKGHRDTKRRRGWGGCGRWVVDLGSLSLKLREIPELATFCSLGGVQRL
jgi:hypothetical protein